MYMSLKSWKLYKQFEIQGRCEVEWLNSGRGDCVVGSGGLCNENWWRKPRAEPCKNGEHVYTSTPWAAAVFVNPLAFVSCSVTSMPLRVPVKSAGELWQGVSSYVLSYFFAPIFYQVQHHLFWDFTLALHWLLCIRSQSKHFKKP